MSPTKRTTKKPTTFSAEERAAMKERARELKAGEVDGTKAVLDKIATLPEPDRSMAQRIHAIVLAAAPTLTPRLWYGMPAYARDDKMICFFQSGQKFKTRYATLGFSDKAQLDDGNIWPNAFALAALTPEVEAKIAALVKKAVG